MQQDGEPRQAQKAANLLQIFLGPFEQWLGAQIDRRLVRAFVLALQAIVKLRHNCSGLLLRNLGAAAQQSAAPPRWSHTRLARFLWHLPGQAGQLEETGDLGHLGRKRPGEAGEYHPSKAILSSKAAAQTH